MYKTQNHIEEIVKQINENLESMDTSQFTSAGDFRNAVIQELKEALARYGDQRAEEERERMNKHFKKTWGEKFGFLVVMIEEDKPVSLLDFLPHPKNPEELINNQ